MEVLMRDCQSEPEMPTVAATPSHSSCQCFGGRCCGSQGLIHVVDRPDLHSRGAEQTPPCHCAGPRCCVVQCFAAFSGLPFLVSKHWINVELDPREPQTKPERTDYPITERGNDRGQGRAASMLDNVSSVRYMSTASTYGQPALEVLGSSPRAPPQLFTRRSRLAE